MKIVIPGNPPRKDDHWSPVVVSMRRAIMRITPDGREFRKKVKKEVDRLRSEGVPWPEGPLFAVQITSYVKQNRNLDGGETVVPRRDIDSSISPVLDALESAAVFGIKEKDADVRVEHLYPPRRFKDAANPRIEIEVTTWRREAP